MVVLRLDEPFAVFSDVHGNLPALEAVLADIEPAGTLKRSASGTSSAMGPRPTRSSRSCATAASPRSWATTTRASASRRATAAASTRPTSSASKAPSHSIGRGRPSPHEVKAHLRTLEDQFRAADSLRRAARRAWQPAAHQRVPSSRTGRPRLWSAWPVRTRIGRSCSDTLIGPTCAGSATRSSSTSGSVGRPKDGDWRACYPTVDPSSRAADGPVVEFVRVEYDYAQLLLDLGTTPLITSFDGPTDGCRSTERQ